MNSNSVISQKRLIESEGFPFEFLSLLGQKESWRKEIYRPVYHMHKWWAKRLGSIFRGLLLGGVLDAEADFEQAFYDTHNMGNVVVLDPFMGSGTTVGEAHKLGMTALGRDINPVACEATRIALSPLEKRRILSAFEEVSQKVEEQIRVLYSTVDSEGVLAETLYYFWVMQTSCPTCQESLDLFKSYIFARNAYPKKKPEVEVFCPNCQGIFQSLHSNETEVCPHCSHSFNIKEGVANGSSASCHCGHKFSVAESIRQSGNAPKYRLYAKLVLRKNGRKEYLPITEDDVIAYQQCTQTLQKEMALGHIQLPSMSLKAGINTKQVINYNFTAWTDFFNARQLLILSWLHTAISEVNNDAERDTLLILFSGVLEFNNMFASYKGEGTGAVRHMFSHHILKPERMPIEANVWGTPKSSGAFSSLFKTRLIRALDYRVHPFEIGLNGASKIYNSSQPMAQHPLAAWGETEPGNVSLSCGDSSRTSLATKSVDLIVTDPPFFDNVNYSELADFFYAWQTLTPRGFIQEGSTTRQENEVQDASPVQFAKKLTQVFTECNRVLKQDGLLIFSYHHSKNEGWEALAEAIWDSGFYVSSAFPVYAELSNSTPKAQAKSPIHLDAILVCRKQYTHQEIPHLTDVVDNTVSLALQQICRLEKAGFKLSNADMLIIGMSNLLVSLGNGFAGHAAKSIFTACRPQLEERLLSHSLTSHRVPSETRKHQAHQLMLF